MEKKNQPIMPIWRKVAKDGSFLLPAAFRKALRIKPGDIFDAHLEDGELVLRLRKTRKKND